MRPNYTQTAKQIAKVIHTKNRNKNTPRLESIVNYCRRNRRFRDVILPRLLDEFPWINERSADETDFHEFCARRNIIVEINPIFTTGVYIRAGSDLHFIFLNPKPKSIPLTYIMFHELGHYLFHQSELSKFHATDKKRRAMRKHLEAEITAALCNGAARLHFPN